MASEIDAAELATLRGIAERATPALFPAFAKSTTLALIDALEKARGDADSSSQSCENYHSLNVAVVCERDSARALLLHIAGLSNINESVRARIAKELGQ